MAKLYEEEDGLIVEEAPAQGEEDEEAGLLLPTDVELPEAPDKDYLVDLIDQPAWKSILITLVKRNRMDPWHIDVGELANLYLKKIQSLDSADLRLPANAILASAILLKFKALVLRLTSIEEAEKEDPFTEEEKKLFEQFFPELQAQRKVREGKVTLDALVDAIESMMRKQKKKPTEKQLFERPEFVIPFDQEDIDKRMEELLAVIKKNVDSQGLTRFSALVKGKPVYEIVRSFIPLLYLANKERVRIWQDEFWGEIFVAVGGGTEGGESVKAP